MSALITPAGYVGDYPAPPLGIGVRAVFNAHLADGLPAAITGGAAGVRQFSTSGAMTAGVGLFATEVAGVYEVEVTPSLPNYFSGSDYYFVLTAGTVGGVDVTGTVLGQFSLANRLNADPPGVTRLLGLCQENSVLVGLTFDSLGRMTAGTLYLYDSAANAETNDGSTGLVAAYDITATYDGLKLTGYTQVRVA